MLFAGGNQKDIISYYRTSLLAGNLPRMTKGETERFSFEEFVEGHIHLDLVERLFERYEKSLDEKDLDEPPEFAPVLIAPLVFLPVLKGGIKQDDGADYQPLIIVTKVNREGQLLVDAEKQPWINREYLIPSIRDELAIGTVDDYDDFLSRNPFDVKTWSDAVFYVKKLCQQLTSQDIEEYCPENYVRSDCLISIGKEGSFPQRNIVELCNYLTGQEEVKDTVLNARPVLQKDKAYLGERLSPEIRKMHLGQMGGDFPLADRQREALLHFMHTPQGQLLAVNGPPGTGKTTLLQSVVASLFVKSALNDDNPPIIFATSTNNQAVTNIIDSFGNAKAPKWKEQDVLTQRWIPELKSFATYCPSQWISNVNSEYMTFYPPNFGKEFYGAIATFFQPENIKNFTNVYLEQAGKYFEKEFSELRIAVAACKERLEEKYTALNEMIDASHEVITHRGIVEHIISEAGGTPHDFLLKQRQLLSEAKKNGKKELDRQEAQVATVKEEYQKCLSEVSEVLSLLEPVSFKEKAMSFMQSEKQIRWLRSKTRANELGFIDGVFAQVKAPDTADVEEYLQDVLDQKKEAFDLRTKEYEKKKAHFKADIKDHEDYVRDLEEAIALWEQSEAAWSVLVGRYEEDRKAYRQRLIDTPESIDRWLDLFIRYDMFLLAARYWEGRFLLKMSETISDKVQLHMLMNRRGKEDVLNRFRLIQHLTPCMVSTLFTLPRFINSNRKNRESSGWIQPPLLGEIDCLIVDEAGQVPPEVGVPPLALAKKAIVVGDEQQIEPVWNVVAAVDRGNLELNNLADHEDTLSTIRGLSCNGSLMGVAQNLSYYSRPDADGMFLNEHRRCKREIIQICNDLCYAGHLEPKRKAEDVLGIPNVGWANIRSHSGVRGASRFNQGEAEAIFDWLVQMRHTVQDYYEKPVEECVAIVTPFGAQKLLLRSLAKQFGFRDTMTIGTVHALQGAEKEIVIFSPVHNADDNKLPFFDIKPNMLNVAVSRAKDSFLVFGDMRYFKEEGNLPSNVLAKHLFASERNEVVNVLYRPEIVRNARNNEIQRLNMLEEHRDILRQAFLEAKERLLIVSPFVSHNALRADDFKNMTDTAVSRGVQITVGYCPSSNLDSKTGKLLRHAEQAVSLLDCLDLELVELSRIHNKTVVVDDFWLIEGSFNWLSASRDSRLNNHENSLSYRGSSAREFCQEAWNEFEMNRCD